MKNLAIPLLAATTQAADEPRRPASMALDIQDQGPNPVGYLGGLTGLVAHETVADSDPVEYVCVYPAQDDVEEMARLKQAVVTAEEAVETQKDSMNEVTVTDADENTTGNNGVVELLRLATVERQAKIDAADTARVAIYVTEGTNNNKAADANVTPFARATESERLLQEAQEAYRVAFNVDAAAGELVDTLTTEVASLLVTKDALALTTTEFMNQMNSAHLSIAIERQRHIIELCRVQAADWATTAATEAAAIATFRTGLLGQWWSLQSTADQEADVAAWGVLDAAAKEAWYDRTTRAGLETTDAGSERWQNWANTTTVLRAAYYLNVTEKYAWMVQNGVNKVANASTLYARAVDISAVYWAEIAAVTALGGQSGISAIPARCIIPPRKFLENDNSDHSLADAGDAFDATDDAVGDTFEVSVSIRIDPGTEDELAANSLTRKMAIANDDLDLATYGDAEVAVAELVQRWRQVNMDMIETLITDNMYRSQLTGGAITPAADTSDATNACHNSDNPINHSTLCAGELAYPVSAAAAFTTQWQQFVGQNLMFEQIFAYDASSAVVDATVVTIGAVVSPGNWDRDAGSTAITPYKLTLASPITVDADSAQAAWPDAYYAGAYSTKKDATTILGAFDSGDDSNAWAWYQSAAALSEATRKMYVETTRNAGSGVYYRIADACDGGAAGIIGTEWADGDTLDDGVSTWDGTDTGTSAVCAALCDARQAYYRATGDRDTLPDLAATDDAGASTTVHCFGYQWTDESTADADDRKCKLGVQYGSFDVAAVDDSATSAAANLCMARFASMAVYGTAAGVGSTVTSGGDGKQRARALNGGDGGAGEVGFQAGYVEAYKNHYGLRDTAGGTVSWVTANNHAAPGALSLEKVFRDMIEAEGVFGAATSSGILAMAKSYAEERVTLLEMGFFAFYATQDKTWVDTMGTTPAENDAQRYPKVLKTETTGKTDQQAVIDYGTNTLDGKNTAVSDATSDLSDGNALVTAAANEVGWQIQAYDYIKADYDAAKALSEFAAGVLGDWSLQTAALAGATAVRDTLIYGTTALLAEALQDFDGAFTYEGVAAPTTLFTDLNTARGERDTAVQAFNDAVRNLYNEQVLLDGNKIATLMQAKAAVVADDLKCKSQNFDAYTAGLLSRKQDRQTLLDDIQEFIEGDVPPAAGTLGARCEKALSNGTFRPARASGAANAEANMTCIGETACCGASRVPLSDARGFLTVETCGTTDQEKYTYTYPREPLAKTRPDTFSATFTCIEGAQRLAAAAAAAATALYMLA